MGAHGVRAIGAGFVWSSRLLLLGLHRSLVAGCGVERACASAETCEACLPLLRVESRLYCAMILGSMFSRHTVSRLYGICLAVAYVCLVAVAFNGLWHRIGTWLTAILLIVLGVGFYFAGVWASLDRPAELQRKMPITSKELRRRKNEFYDWLAKQGRR